MDFNTLYLQFKSPLHIGNHRSEDYANSEEFIRSDTIISAVMSVWARIGKEEWISDYINDPDFVVSSAFPYTTVLEEKIHFLPKPKVPWQLRSFDPDRSKKLKKAKWLDSVYFKILINAESIDDFGNNDVDLRGDFVCKHDISTPIFAEVQDRVNVSRDGAEDARPYVFERIRFADGAGLYFMVSGDLARLKIALEVLQEEGFGTDRSVGNGLFTISEGKMNLDVPDSDMGMNLGLYYASSHQVIKDQLNEKSRFSLVKRGGWITTPHGMGKEKNNVYMLEEGSVLACTEQIAGKHDILLTPEIMTDKHPIYRSGRTLFIPIKTDDHE